MKRVGVQSLLRELRPHMPCGQKAKTYDRSNTVTNSTKTLKMVHIKKKFLKKKNLCKDATMAKIKTAGGL